MKIAQLLFGALLLLPLYAGEESGPSIRVLLVKSAPSALLEAKGAYCVVRPETGMMLSTGSVGKRYVIHAIEEGLRWGEEFPGVSKVKILPVHQDTLFYVGGYQYKGSMEVSIDQNHTITVINEVPIEEYIRSTLAIKFDEPLSQEAMSAMAIAARTESYAKAIAGKEKMSQFDVVASTEKYFGFGVTMQKNGVEEAVENTKFMVLATTLGRPLEEVHLLTSKVEELAVHGQDAKHILQTCYPHSRLTVTSLPKIR